MSILVDSKKKLLEGRNIFLVALTNEWNSPQRMILKDAKIILASGGQVFLYTFKDSILDIKAKSIGIECFYHQGTVATSFFKWNKLKKVSRLIRVHKIDLVHCYDIKFLWPLCYFLKTRPLIPLVMSIGKELTRFYRGFWYQPLNRRLDQVLTTSTALNENVWGNLGIPPIKVSCIGLATKDISASEVSLPAFRFGEDRWYLGTNFNGTEKEIKFLDDLFYALRTLATQKIAGKEILFVLINEKPWSQCLITDELRGRVKDWGLEHHVAFAESEVIESMQKHLDLWVGTKVDEVLEDYSISALLNGIPCVFPRRNSSMELIREYGKVGETYKVGDARSLRKQCESVLTNYKSYEKAIKSRAEELSKRFSFESYFETFAKNYHQLIKRRHRLMRGRKKVFKT